ncbi:penicillin-binding [Paraphaeosphaeria sporulosa]
MATEGKSGSVISEASRSPLDEEFAAFAHETLKEWKVPGVSIAVIDGDDIFAEASLSTDGNQGYGMATLPDTPATPSTLWYGASTTKAFTAALLAKMIDSGTYDALNKGWQTPISSIIRDDFVLQDEWSTQHLTLEDAATHRTGMPRHDKSSMRQHDCGRQVTVREIVRNLRNLQIHEQPRVKFLYNNFMYVVLSHVIETLQGQGLEDALREEIWDLLGMKSTCFSVEAAQGSAEHFASCYYWDEKEEAFKEVPPMGVFENSGAGAVLTNVLDYAKWVKCLLHESPPFSAKVHQDIKTPRIFGAMPMGPMDVNLYGLGWERNVYRNTPFYKHDGGMHAAGATVLWVPSRKLGVVGFANTSLSSNAVLETLVWRLVDDRLGAPTDERNAFTSMKWHGLLSKVRDDASNAVKILYPDLPDPPLPPTATTSEVVGKYYDKGYKTLNLSEAPHPDKPDEKILVAPRENMTWRSRMEFHHVSGDYWIVWSIPAGITTPYCRDYMRAQFKRGPDGKVSSLEILMETHLGYTYEGPVSFRRVA